MILNSTGVRAIKGWLPSKTMPASLSVKTGKPHSLSNFRHVFANQIRGKAADGNDFDIPNEPDCYDQGDIGSCVLNATTGAEEILEAVEGNPTTMLSRLFAYWLCREQMGTLDQDSGTYPQLAVFMASLIGFCSENMWAYSDGNLLTAPPPECYPAASDNKATAWFQVTATGSERLAQMETVIRASHPVIFGTPVDSNIQNYQAGQVLTIPDPNNIIGGHGIVFTGVRYINGQRCWRVRNSWGTGYGDNGHFLMDDAWASWEQLDDLWVMTKMNPLMF